MLSSEHWTHVGETLQTATLDNGLKLQFVVKPDFHKTYALFTTRFGSIDNSFRVHPDDEFTTVPAGTAHFLEHKLFDKEDYDAFDLFGRTGASSNAFTSANQTSFLFAASDRIPENIDILLDFVQNPYFTEKTVNKEKGIIGQEIQMYRDDPNWQSYSGILGNLYPQHPVHLDVAGSVESIAKITPDILYRVHNAFYRPDNMTLTVVGNFDADEIYNLVANKEAKRDTEYPGELESGVKPDYELSSILPYRAMRLPISRPKGIVGLKGSSEVPDNMSGMKRTFALRLFLELIFGDSGSTFLDLYNRGVIDDSFYSEFNVGRGYNYIALGGDATNPAAMTEELIDLIMAYKDNPNFTSKRFDMLKKAAIGKFYSSLNSIESIANQLAGQSFSSVSLFAIPELISALTFDDVQNAAEDIVHHESLSVFHLLAQEEG
ncbi:pitrilysin family protein [Lacticaseibacillus pabuli]|uniref:Pitrilysin family protein n=1 Tax=Lacticaseibacillus pabuli TaxID=3025672 RepID=A0ABY7WPH3_9LACO|nr:pitrilysin family protein [Lacticaseibacillus sp. KACC 23028]WDF82006.1 pitrilysin family protein [Lacticaseibacillus sp. KACC 23028]